MIYPQPGPLENFYHHAKFLAREAIRCIVFRHVNFPDDATCTLIRSYNKADADTHSHHNSLSFKYYKINLVTEVFTSNFQYQDFPSSPTQFNRLSSTSRGVNAPVHLIQQPTTVSESGNYQYMATFSPPVAISPVQV